MNGKGLAVAVLLTALFGVTMNCLAGASTLPPLASAGAGRSAPQHTPIARHQL